MRLVKSSAGKSRRSFFHERSCCFLMILGAAGFDLAAGLQIEKLGERTVFCSVKILLHQGEGDPWSVCQFLRELHGSLGEIGVRNDPIDHAQ